MGLDLNKQEYGVIVDICDSIVSVSGLDSAFSGEVIHFQSEDSEITGWVWNIEDIVCKVPIIIMFFFIFFCFVNVLDIKSGHYNSSFLSENYNPAELWSLTNAEKKRRSMQFNDIFMSVRHRDLFQVVLFDRRGMRHYYEDDPIIIYTGHPFKFHIRSDVKITSCFGVPINGYSGFFTFSLTRYDAIREDTIVFSNGNILHVKLICLPLLPLYNPSFSRVYKGCEALFKAIASVWGLLFFIFVILF